MTVPLLKLQQYKNRTLPKSDNKTVIAVNCIIFTCLA
jgi:hypothetical protein